MRVHDHTVRFTGRECGIVAQVIGLSSILLGVFTLGYPPDNPAGLARPPAWAVGHIAAGVMVIVSMRWRHGRGHQTAGALVAALGVLRGVSIGVEYIGRWQAAIGVVLVLWLSYGFLTLYVWVRMIAPHIAWSRDAAA